jgi:hypothetical protein
LANTDVVCCCAFCSLCLDAPQASAQLARFRRAGS